MSNVIDRPEDRSASRRLRSSKEEDPAKLSDAPTAGAAIRHLSAIYGFCPVLQELKQSVMPEENEDEQRRLAEMEATRLLRLRCEQSGCDNRWAPPAVCALWRHRGRMSISSSDHRPRRRPPRPAETVGVGDCASPLIRVASQGSHPVNTLGVLLVAWLLGIDGLVSLRWHCTALAAPSSVYHGFPW